MAGGEHAVRRGGGARTQNLKNNPMHSTGNKLPACKPLSSWPFTSIGILPRCLDDRRPAVDFAGQHRPERLRRRLVLRDRLGVDVVEPGDQRGIPERGLEHRRQLLNDRGRRALRGIEAVPDAELEPLEAGLVGGRQIGQALQPLLCGDSVGLDLLGRDRPGRVRRLVEVRSICLPSRSFMIGPLPL